MSQEMADHCVPGSHISPRDGGAGTKKHTHSINLRKKRVVCSPVENKPIDVIGNPSRRKVPRRKKMRGRENQRVLYSRLQDVKAAHQKAKRSRPLVKDKRREIHRQNERFRHQSLNLAISELSQLVPQSDHRRVDTKQNIVQRTGDYMKYLNTKISEMCRQVGVTTKASDDFLVFNKSLMSVFNGHTESFPAAKPVDFSSLEALLQDMHIGRRVYSPSDTLKGSEEPDLDVTGNESKKSTDKRKIKNKAVARPWTSGACMVMNGKAMADVASSRLISPSLLIPKPVVAAAKLIPITPGYLGDSEETVSSSHGGTSSFSSPAELSAQSQMSSDLESEAQGGSIEDEVVMTMLGGSSVNRDHCYTSSSLNPDLSEALPFLLPSTLGDMTPSSGLGAGGSTDQGCPALGGMGIRTGTGHPPEGSSTSGASVSSPARIRPLASPDMTLRNEISEERIAMQALGLTPGENQLALPLTASSEIMNIRVEGRIHGQMPVVGSNNGPSDRDQGDHIQGIAPHSGHPSSVQRVDASGAATLCRSWNDGYQLFFRVNHPSFQQAWPYSDEGDLKKLLTQAWNGLPEDARKIYRHQEVLAESEQICVALEITISETVTKQEKATRTKGIRSSDDEIDEKFLSHKLTQPVCLESTRALADTMTNLSEPFSISESSNLNDRHGAPGRRDRVLY